MKAYISEIFSSLQGEGIYQGVRQIFVRFAGCNLNCDYCDTPESRVISVRCKVKGEKQEIANPVSTEDLIGLLTYPSFPNPYSLNNCHSLCLTGGEPLLQVDFLEEFIPAVRDFYSSVLSKPKELGLKIYLETNGTLPEKLDKIVNLVDFIAMDIKLPSATGKSFFPRHRHFLELGGRKVFVKIVLTGNTKNEEIWETISLVKNINREIPFVLQPVILNSEVSLPKTQDILTWYTWAKKNLADVRILPQKHKTWGLK